MSVDGSIRAGDVECAWPPFGAAVSCLVGGVEERRGVPWARGVLNERRSHVGWGAVCPGSPGGDVMFTFLR